MFRSPDDEDRRLLDRVIRQDERALRALVQRHQRLLYGLCLRVIGSREDAEEAASEAFLRLWRKADLYRGECSVKSFLCRIALNECRDRLRRRKSMTMELEDEGHEISQDGLAVRCALLHLEEMDRTVIVLYHLEGLTTDEAAEVLDTTTGALKMRLVRARGRLKAILEDRDE
jgi:RNA polymerase sigma-70 factor (ECF subfamily)